MEHPDEVSPVVDDQVRTGFQDPPEIRFILLRSGAVDGEDVHPLPHECGGDVVLGREGVAAGHIHLGAAFRKDLAEVGGLGFEMDAEGDFQACERPAGGKLFADGGEERHMVPDPADLQFPALPNLPVSDVTSHGVCNFKGAKIKKTSCSPKDFR